MQRIELPRMLSRGEDWSVRQCVADGDLDEFSMARLIAVRDRAESAGRISPADSGQSRHAD